MTDIETNSTSAADTKVSDLKSATTSRKPNKFEDARLAKKKKRRAAHRATIKRSNANG